MRQIGCGRSATSTRLDPGAPAGSWRTSVSLRLLLLVACVVTAGCDSASEAQAPEQIIFLSLDTLRADMLNHDGYQEYPTSPFLDSFAAANVVFETAIVTEPRTLTSHMSFFTGLLPQHHSVQDDAPLRASIPTLTSVLKAQAYHTQAFVDGGYMRKWWGFDRGFDGYDDAASQRQGGLERIVPMAVDWLSRHTEDRFFLFLHTYDVHSKGRFPYYYSPPPYRGMFSARFDSDLFVDSAQAFKARWDLRGGAPSEADKRFIRATYAEGIRYVDDQLRQFFATLWQMGVYDRALIIVWSDHGEGLFDHEKWAHGEVFDHTTRVPLIMKIPGRAGPARVRTVVSSVDLAPTILELVGVPHAIEGDGISLLQFLESEDTRRVAYSIRTKRGARRFAVRSQSHHLLVDHDEERFFDLREDPGERHDILGQQRTEWKPLREKLSRFIEQYDRDSTGAPVEARDEADAETLEQLQALGYIE